MAELLIVDDSKIMRDMIVACLRPDPSLSFSHASSGLEAIEQLSLRSFDLIVLDLNMPDIGGIEVVDFIRSQDRLQQLPIIIVTTRGNRPDDEQ
jgi:two-component system chemotaxis response regulator CheY